jgi:cysteine desulfurase
MRSYTFHVQRVYLDHAATTPVDPEVAAAMARVLTEVPGNPSSIYAEGRQARALVDRAREEVAAAIGAEPAEIVFTSGGTEADNLALRGVLKAREGEADGLVISTVEHHAVLDTAADLERHGLARVARVATDRDGLVDPADVERAIDRRTALVSIMHANNEIGTIEPIEAIGEVCRSRGVAFHTDAVQTVGVLPFDVRALTVDLVSINAHKFYGPKGVGALYVRRGTRVATMQTGGGQEKGRRTGTENVAGIVALGVAMRIAAERRDEDARRMTRLRDRVIDGVRARIPGAVLTGHPTRRLPNNASFCFPGTQGESLIVALDLDGISVSSGSACTSGDTEPSHVLTAIGLARDVAQGSLRITAGRDTTDADVDRLLDVLPKVVERLRSVSEGPRGFSQMSVERFGAAEDLYSATAVDHFTNPRNVGGLDDPDGKGSDTNPSCGDRTSIAVRVTDGRIADARFRTFGCVAAIASASALTELAKGRTMDEARAIEAADVIGALGGLPARKEGCALMAVGALRAALVDTQVRT